MTGFVELISSKVPMFYRGAWFVPCLLSMVLTYCGSVAGGAETIGDAAEIDLPFLRTEVLSIHDAVRYLDVTYQLNSHVAGDDLSTGRESTHHLIVHDAVRYRENLHGRTTESTFLDLDHGIQMWSPQQMATYEVKNRVLKIASPKYASPYSWKVRYDRFMIYIGWWPVADSEEPPVSRKQLHVHLRHILSSDDYRIRSGRERVDGAACVVIETKDQSDAIWLDPACGFGIRRRVTSAPETGHVLEEYTASEFTSHSLPAAAAKQRIWIPGRIDVKTTSETEPSASFRSVLTVKKISFDAPVQEGIDFDPGEGTLIWNMDTGTTLATSGGIELLDENVRRAGQLAAARETRARPANSTFLWTHRRLLTMSLAWLSLAANLVTAISVTLLLFQYFRRPIGARLPQT